jgi:hypothetical protein
MVAVALKFRHARVCKPRITSYATKPHYLQLFHYVAKHGGIGEAVKHVPYGIQQPALSSQMMELEDQVGTVLFQALSTGRLSLRVTEHNSSGRRDRTFAADPRQSDHRHNSWSWCFEDNSQGKSRDLWSGPNDTALDT